MVKKIYRIFVSMMLSSMIFGMFSISVLSAQPKTPVSQWKNKTILFIGAHPDDDGGAHGTFAMLEDHGNKVYVLTLTTGNVGTKDTTMTRNRLSKIRRKEEIGALKTVGVPKSHYINLGYTDGMVQFENKKAIERRIVYWIRKLQPDVMIDFDPGYGFKYWHKTDHRAAAVLGTDAARMAEWRLIFPDQIIHDGLKPHWIPEYLLYGGLKKYINTKINVTPYVDQMVKSQAKYISQYSSDWYNYRGPDPSDLPGDEGKKYMKKVRENISKYFKGKDGNFYEKFRYYKGSPDGIGQFLKGNGTHGPGGM